MQKTAKYKQIEDYIKQEISRKNLQIGDQIMTEEQLCQRFNFSRMTINKALNHLSTLGYIERIPGRGFDLNRIACLYFVHCPTPNPPKSAA